jgi:hypothetical protein
MNHLPMRGDAVEAWLLKRRDDIRDSNNPAWQTLNDLFIEYVGMADKGKVMVAPENKIRPRKRPAAITPDDAPIAEQYNVEDFTFNPGV